MKTLHVNLAAKPFRDYVPVNLVVAAAWLVSATLAFFSFETWLRYQHETLSTRAKIERIDAAAAHEQRIAEDAQARLKHTNLLALARQANFVNSQIDQRAFSWSTLLDRLERVLTNDTRILQITPSFDKSGKGVRLELSCETKTSEGLVNLLRNFNRDPHFANPFPHVEAALPTGYNFSVSVEYRPDAGPALPAEGARE